MQIELLHLDGEKRGQSEFRPEPVVLLGSGPTAQVRYHDDPLVAPEHARIRYSEAGCAYHLEALDGPVFVNAIEIREVILQHGDLIQLGKKGPRLRFRVFALPGEVCKPIHQMIRDAGQVRHDSGLFRATSSLSRDFIFRSSWKVRVVTPLIMATAVLIASYLGGHLASSRAARDHEATRQQDEEARLSEIGALREYINDLERRQSSLVSRQELSRIRTELDEQRELVADSLAGDRVFAEVLERYSASVCLIHGIYGFSYERNGKTEIVTEASGDPLAIEYTGSGFLVSKAGEVVTNRHVAEPWWESAEVERFIAAGFKPAFTRLDVIFPGHGRIAVDPKTIVISPDGVDVAILSVAVKDIEATPLETLAIEEFRGRRVVLLGYPTGVGALLARSERDDLDEIFQVANDLSSIIDELAKRQAISPIITQGALNEVKERRLVYDAATTSGGSGGPVFGPNGNVIGVNFAITRNFDGSNFGVPIGYARKLMTPSND